MKNTNFKKWAIIAGLLIACGILIAVICGKFADKPQADGIPQSSSKTSSEVNPNSSNSEEKDIVIASNPDSKPTDTTNSAGTEQSIQPDPVKPEPPESKQPPKETPPPEKPSVGDGEIYIPGFGAVPDEGGGGIGEDTGSDGDWDKIIGH